MVTVILFLLTFGQITMATSEEVKTLTAAIKSLESVVRGINKGSATTEKSIEEKRKEQMKRQNTLSGIGTISEERGLNKLKVSSGNIDI